ncbi:MAG: heme ABC transporter ATP-binding protein [Desulfobacterales bacterium]|uniref:Heme ABC transporter ATP-binding protein n=1 Tax=Candidatus Desulfaltia bathyphila TaxID=2841697 RepID=A0A8J6N470_9BACT|nr:heme ABC transporter ATP-binding protein [Candidatus Desulfaltia bathyphila]MBL7194715.1 heme ABC transporter ATP-binding protein [Desulfobacterales bacterium]MBL7207317.1 heme ABC transporter ATP-binding protein [Desulfobacterales bacterium]
MKKAVEIKSLSFSYIDNEVLKNLSFSISEGEFFIIIGPNGSGKTTLMKTIAGILKPKQGKLRIFDRPLKDYTRKDLAKTVALVPQMAGLDFPFTVTELVLMGRSPHLSMLGFEQEKDLEIADKAMTLTGVDHLAHRKIDQLSGGECQRVFIARAICQEPKIILLDEPTASLDLAHQVKVMDLMEKLKKEIGFTVIVVLHDVNLAAMYGSHLLLLNAGIIASLGKPKDVLTRQLLEKTYNCKLLVDESPAGKFPRITLVPGLGGRGLGD